MAHLDSADSATAPKTTLNSTARASGSASPLLFILGIEAVFCFFACVTNRVPNHDSFQYFHLQYYFLNNAVCHGEIPQWMPYMTEGTVANWWYSVQGGVFQNAILMLAPYIGFAIKPLNFIWIFYAGIFVDHLFWLTGTWLLADRMYSSRWTCTYVTLAAAGTAIWFDQIWWNFHLFHTLPLILYLAHRSLDTGKWRYFIGALNLFSLQTLGSLPYCIAYLSLVLFLFVALQVALNFKTHLRVLSKPWTYAGISVALAFGLATTGASYLILKLGTEQIVSYNVGRNSEGVVGIAGFLTYGSETSLLKWVEILWGISPGLDNTLFFGFMGAPFLLASLLTFKWERLHLYLIVAFAVMFGTGSFVTLLTYYAWPGMKYFRHIGLTSGLARSFLVYVAGYGFEALFTPEGTKIFSGRLPKWSSISCAISGSLMLSLVACTHLVCASNPQTGRQLMGLVDKPTYALLLTDKDFLIRFCISGTFAALTGGILVYRSNQLVLTRRMILAAISICAIDLYIYKGLEFNMRTVNLEDASLASFQDITYSYRRSAVFSGGDRAKRLAMEPAMHGAKYWTLGSFAFVDEAASSFRVDHWLLPFDDYQRTFWKQPIRDLREPPRGREELTLKFPLWSEAACKISGLTEDKIQFFSEAFFADDDFKVSELMSHPEFKGNVLLITGTGNPAVSAAEISVNDRIKLFYSVEAFDSNHIVVNVNNTRPDGAWLFYSDVWNQNWTAMVSGAPVQIYKADLAYKAVRIPPGKSQVNLRFQIPWLQTLYLFFGLNSVPWLVAIMTITVRAIRNKPGE